MRLQTPQGLAPARRLAIAATVVTALAGGSVAVGAGLQERQGFPHGRHQGLFPLCTGCHEGIPQSDQASFYPTPETCARCHDGEQEPRVSWSAPEARVSNLRFDHRVHAGRLERGGDPTLECSDCHTPEGRDRMAVSQDIQLGTCFGCHEHEAQEHLVDAYCRTCHTPLARSDLPLAAIEALPVPEDHEAPNFVLEGHGSSASSNWRRCATCHTADRCAACHVDPDRPEIESLEYAPEGMELAMMTAHYPKPATHDDEGWFDEHGTQASREACATCHTQDDCASCHAASLPAPAAQLPRADQVVAPGVGIEAHAPESHASLFFLDAHTVLAAAEPGSCATCHEESFCVSCHDGPSDGGYHPPDFVARHPAASFGREAECANCHSTEAFCRECHQESGLTSLGRLGPGYHSAGAFWLIRHGQAARQGLESCISCHKQTDCTQCHGVAGAFKVSPHSADFDARSAWERSPRTCLACHLRNPLNGSQP